MSTEAKTGPLPGLNIIFVYADSPAEWNCSQWRALTPSDAMNKAGQGWRAKLIHVSGFMNFLDEKIQDLVWPADLIIFQRNIVNTQAWAAIDYWLGMGKPMAVDLDDAYQILPYSNPAYKYWHEKPGDWEGETIPGAAIRYLETGLRKTNALIAPNLNLLQGWSHVCNGYYLQNYAQDDWWENLPDRPFFKEQEGLAEKIVIGWGGSVSHYDSWWGAGLREAAESISRRHPEVVWKICGNDQRIFQQLPVSPYHKKHQPGVPPQEWPRQVRSFDIGLAPLFGWYDQHRSWLKGLEYALAGVPWVGSAGPVYDEVQDIGGTLVQNEARHWEEAIEDLLADLPAAQEALAARQEEAYDRFFISRNLDNHARTYRAIIQNFRPVNTMLPGVLDLRKASHV